MTTMLKRSVVLALVLALVAVPSAAFADDTSTRDGTDVVSDEVRERPHDALDELKRRALETIEKQLNILAGLRSKIGSHRYVTDAHAAQLYRDIDADAEALHELARKIEDAATLEELRPLILAIAHLQIGNVLVPKTNLVLASDTLVVVAGKLERFSEKLGDVIARFDEAGFDVDEAWRMLEEMQDGIAEGIRLADPVAESVIGLQAADWPDPAAGLLGQGRADLHAAGASLQSAYRIGGEIVKFLRNLYDGVTDVEVGSSSSDA
jgi:hypothetical protein